MHRANQFADFQHDLPPGRLAERHDLERRLSVVSELCWKQILQRRHLVPRVSLGSPGLQVRISRSGEADDFPRPREAHWVSVQRQTGVLQKQVFRDCQQIIPRHARSRGRIAAKRYADRHFKCFCRRLRKALHVFESLFDSRHRDVLLNQNRAQLHPETAK